MVYTFYLQTLNQAEREIFLLKLSPIGDKINLINLINKINLFVLATLVLEYQVGKMI